MQKDIDSLTKEHQSLFNKTNGYQHQVEVWKTTVEKIGERETNLEEKVKQQEKRLSNHEKNIDNKIKKFTNLESNIQKEMKEISKLKSDLKKFSDSSELKEISKAQEFVGAKFDEMIERTKNMDEKVNKIEAEKEINVKTIKEINNRLDGNIKTTKQN